MTTNTAAPLAQKPGERMRAILNSPDVQAGISKALARSGVTAERVYSMLMLACQKNADIALCTPASIVNAALLCAQTGLDASGTSGQVYLIPRRNKDRGGALEVNWQLGYKGMLALARRSGIIEDIDAKAVHEGDVFEVGYGPNAKLVHEPKLRGMPGPTIGAYCWYILRGSTRPVVRFLTIDEIEDRRSRSQMPNGPAWRDDYDSMAAKSAIRAAWNTIPFAYDDPAFAAIEGDGADDAILTAAVAEATVTTTPEAPPSPLDAMRERMERETPPQATPCPEWCCGTHPPGTPHRARVADYGDGGAVAQLPPGGTTPSGQPIAGGPSKVSVPAADTPPAPPPPAKSKRAPRAKKGEEPGHDAPPADDGGPLFGEGAHGEVTEFPELKAAVAASLAPPAATPAAPPTAPPTAPPAPIASPAPAAQDERAAVTGDPETWPDAMLSEDIDRMMELRHKGALNAAGREHLMKLWGIVEKRSRARDAERRAAEGTKS